MKKLFASAVYSFDNFYSNLNTQGQIIFSTIIILISVLCILLFVVQIIQSIQTKRKLKELRTISYKENEKETKNEQKTSDIDKPLFTDEQTQIEDIASAINEALKEERPISLTNFEEDQERTAIISIDELMQKARELELVEDEKTGVNYLEKYNLEPSEVEEAVNSAMNNEKPKEVKAFKVSQVISPIYGVRKEAIENNK